MSLTVYSIRRISPKGPRQCFVPRARRGCDDSKENERTLDAFEVAALTNINPDDADEAKSLIPSLGKFEDDEIEDLLKIISSSAAMAT